MKILPVLITIILLSISFNTFAHVGHDHQSSYSSLIHLLWLAPVFFGLGFLYSKILSQLYNIDK